MKGPRSKMNGLLSERKWFAKPKTSADGRPADGPVARSGGATRVSKRARVSPSARALGRAYPCSREGGPLPGNRLGRVVLVLLPLGAVGCVSTKAVDLSFDNRLGDRVEVAVRVLDERGAEKQMAFAGRPAPGTEASIPVSGKAGDRVEVWARPESCQEGIFLGPITRRTLTPEDPDHVNLRVTIDKAAFPTSIDPHAVAMTGGSSLGIESDMDPQYKSWARAAPGTSIVETVTLVSKSGRTSFTLRSRLVQVAADAVKLEQTFVDLGEGTPRNPRFQEILEEHKTPVEIPAHTSAPAGGPVFIERFTETAETREAGGLTLPGKLQVGVKVDKTGRTSWKVWGRDDLPGWYGDVEIRVRTNDEEPESVVTRKLVRIESPPESSGK